MRKSIIFTVLFLFCGLRSSGQSFELMPGTERIFIDAQFLKFFDEQSRWSLFSRARATAEYDDNRTDLFTGAYLNYTTKSGVGGTVLGRISSFSSGVDMGVHFFRATEKWVVYALLSININDDLAYSWFSIVRFTPGLSKEWKMYSSLELFSAFNRDGYVSSVQRLRLGVDKKGYQFGLAVNLRETGKSFEKGDANPGVFVRKAFD